MPDFVWGIGLAVVLLLLMIGRMRKAPSLEVHSQVNNDRLRRVIGAPVVYRTDTGELYCPLGMKSRGRA